MSQLCWQAIDDLNCLGYSMKLRTHNLFDRYSLPPGLICAQPYLWSHSHETRLIWRREDPTDKNQFTRLEYLEFTNKWNYVRGNGSLTNEQSGRLLELALLNENFLDYKPGSNDLLAYVFSISNAKNVRDAVASQFLKDGKHVAILPSSLSASLWPDGHYGIHYNNGVITRIRDKNIWSDYCYHPNEFNSYYVFNLRDYLCALQYSESGKKRFECLDRGTDGAMPFMNLWFVATNFAEMTECEIQTWINSQTHYARVWTQCISRLFGMDDVTRHILRKAALWMLYPSAKLIDHDRINGWIPVRGRRYYVAVSGHIGTLLMMSAYYLFDFERYFDTVEFQLRTVRRDRNALRKHARLRETLAESNWRMKSVLWHSYIEYRVGLAWGIMMCHWLKLKINLRALNYCCRRLKMIQNRFPEFNRMGFQASHFTP